MSADQWEARLAREALRLNDASLADRYAADPQAQAALAQIENSGGPRMDWRNSTEYTNSAINSQYIAQNGSAYAAAGPMLGTNARLDPITYAYAQAASDPNFAKLPPEQQRQVLGQLTVYGQSLQQNPNASAIQRNTADAATRIAGDQARASGAVPETLRTPADSRMGQSITEQQIGAAIAGRPSTARSSTREGEVTPSSSADAATNAPTSGQATTQPAVPEAAAAAAAAQQATAGTTRVDAPAAAADVSTNASGLDKTPATSGGTTTTAGAHNEVAQRPVAGNADIPPPKVTVNADGTTEIVSSATPLARQRELNTNDETGSGVPKPAEAGVAAQLEPVLGTMQRYDGAPTSGSKAPDFEIVSGPNAGKTVEMMYTTGSNSAREIDGMNKFFEKNMTVPGADGVPPRGVTQIQDHLAKADIVVMDFRTLTPKNQQIVLDYIKTLPAAQRAQINIIK